MSARMLCLHGGQILRTNMIIQLDHKRSICIRFVGMVYPSRFRDRKTPSVWKPWERVLRGEMVGALGVGVGGAGGDL